MSLHTPYAEFPTTHWSVVQKAGLADDAASRAALRDLVTRYAPVLKWHLVRDKGLTSHDAEDVLQSFLAEKVLEQNLFALADRDRGRFRNFLLTTLDRFLSNQRRAEAAQKRSPKHKVPLDGFVENSCAQRERADTFDVAWARQVLAEAVSAMRDHCLGAGRADLWRVFEARILHPALRQTVPVPYQDLVDELHFASPAQASNALVTAQRTFGRVMHGVIGRYEREPAQIEEELADLRRILSMAGAESAPEACIPV